MSDDDERCEYMPTPKEIAAFYAEQEDRRRRESEENEKLYRESEDDWWDEWKGQP